jgi:hypothetical protein
LVAVGGIKVKVAVGGIWVKVAVGGMGVNVAVLVSVGVGSGENALQALAKIISSNKYKGIMIRKYFINLSPILLSA